MSRSLRRIATLVAALGFIGLGAAPASASHAWANYHWSRSSFPFTVTLGDNVTSEWTSYLATAAADWGITDGICNNILNPVRCEVVSGAAHVRPCKPALGRVEVCNARYGNRGWLGLAGIYVQGDHIVRALVKLNDYYFVLPQYDTPAWRGFVMAQEIGHVFGLAHQDEDFNNADLLDACGRGSCMDYSADPSNNTSPNQHDYDQLATIYSHFDGAAPAVAQEAIEHAVDEEDPSAWGQATRFDRGRGVVYERALGGGAKLVTFVIWAE